jgi:hypothetical protein
MHMERIFRVVGNRVRGSLRAGPESLSILVFVIFREHVE